MVLLVISPLNYSDEKTSLLNGNMALYIHIMIVCRIAFLTPFFPLRLNFFFPLRLNFNQRHYLHKGAYYQRRLWWQGPSRGL